MMQYMGYLCRNPDDAPDSDASGFNFWLDKLDAFGGDFHKAQMVKAFIASAGYRQRFAHWGAHLLDPWQPRLNPGRGCFLIISTRIRSLSLADTRAAFSPPLHFAVAPTE